jgi:septum site-determining protein MinC
MKGSIISLMGKDQPLYQTKGSRDGILITLGECSWLELRNALLDQIKSQPSFFHGAKLALDVVKLELRVAELSSLRDTLSEYGINLWAVLSESPLTITTAQNLGLATQIVSNRVHNNRISTNDFPAEAAKWVKGPLRSGVKVTHQGNIVIQGDVNPGAEIIAGGNIIVWGRLRGVVHAGVDGDEKMVVCALEMAPTQLRIADKIAVSPKKVRTPVPEIARLIDGMIIAEPWQHNRIEK